MMISRESSRTVHGIEELVNPEGLLLSPDTKRQEESNMTDDISYSTRRETPSRSSDVLVCPTVRSSNVLLLPLFFEGNAVPEE